MIELTYLFAAGAVLLGLICSISVWAPRRLAPKAAALGLALAFLPLGYASLAQLLALPKPITLEWWHQSAAEATVLAASLREDQAIYLWLQLEGAGAPRAYRLPWDRALAEQLQAAERAARAGDDAGAVRMRLPFEATLDDQAPRFYATPQPAPPPKDPAPAAPPRVYERPAAPSNDA